jgi:hypothetical protein
MINSVVEWYRPQAGGALEADRIADAVVRLAFDGLRTGGSGTGTGRG